MTWSIDDLIMIYTMENDLVKTKFLQIYANLPLNQRNEIIIVIDDESLTWNAVKIEVENDTLMGRRILDKLIGLGIIK